MLVLLSRSHLCVAIFLLTASLPVAGRDWPQWGGRDDRNMVSDARGLPASFVPGDKLPSGKGIDPTTTRNVKWTARLGSQTYGNPTVAGGRVFVGTDDIVLKAPGSRFQATRGGLVQCLDEATGKLLWTLVVPKRSNLPKGTHFGHQHLGTCSSPTVDGNRVYVVTSASDLVCLDVAGQADGNDGPFKDEGRAMVRPGEKPVEITSEDADIIWQLDMMTELGVRPHDAASNSVLVHGDLLYLGTSNGVDGPHKAIVAPDAPSLIVVDKRTGRVVATDGEKISSRLYHAQWSSPSMGIVNGKTLIFFGGGDGVCYAFEALSGAPEASGSPVELKTVWKCDCNPPEYKYRDGKPIPYYDGDRRKRRGNKNDGKYIGPNQLIASPVFHAGRIYLPTGQDPAHGRGKAMLHCIDASKSGDITKTGILWSYHGIERTMSTVAVADGLVYCADTTGRLHVVDADTGALRWMHDTKAEIWSSPLVADGKVYLGTKKDFWVLAAGKEMRVIAKIRLGTPVFASAIVANDVLFIASQKYLWAVRADGRASRS